MKKVSLLVLCLVMAACVFAGCKEVPASGGDSSKAASETSSVEGQASEEESSEAASGKAADGNKIVADIVEATQSSIASMEQMAGGLMSISIEARGNAFVYIYKYKSHVPDASTKTALEGQKSLLESSMQLLLSEMKGQGVSDASVIVEYLNDDGSMITSFEFK